MSDRRTLQELKLLLAASRIAESDLLSLILPQTGDSVRGGFPNRAIRDYEWESIKSGKFPTPKFDASRGITGSGSVADLEKAYPEFKAERDRLIAIEEKANRKRDKLVAAPERKERTRKGAANPFQKGRRRLVAQQLQQLRGSPEGRPGVGRQAAKFEILRLLSERPEHTRNPLIEIAQNFKKAGGEDFDNLVFDSMGDASLSGSNYKEAEKKAIEDATKQTDIRKKKIEASILKQKNQITPYRLRRMTDADLDKLLSAGFKDPRVTALLLEEKRLRLFDAYNRSMGRRGMIQKTAAQAIKPSLPIGKGGGSGGEKVAKTFLRLLTRGRGG